MMSLSQFRINLFKAFMMMKDSKAVFEVYHRRKVYLVHVQKTDRKVETPYKRTTARRNKISPQMITSESCPDCKDLLINGLCMNRDCKTNQKAPVSN